ncbi:MAG: Asp-tRNA(Asn)/Glu-tRNA(Gln) amidotransferase subunit GatC [Gammaproteobacteria bacterium]|jgi:aspartyl-tRNA(Asn)/glutamyl-tRNA(Gln) amidotransferase subunit C
MAVTPDEVSRIATLARLAIDQTDAPYYATQLSKILEFVAQMNSVDTSGVQPMAHPLDAKSRLRDDAITEVDQRALMQSVAPAVEEGLYLVPRVIE